MNLERLLIEFSLEGKRIGLPLSRVERVIPSVQVTGLPKAPDIVTGVINVHGRIIPVLDIRKRFNLPQRELALSDKIILARTSKRDVAIIADGVGGVVEAEDGAAVEASSVLPGLEYIRGIVKIKDGILLIHDIDTFLSLDEEAALDSAFRDLSGVWLD